MLSHSNIKWYFIFCMQGNTCVSLNMRYNEAPSYNLEIQSITWSQDWQKQSQNNVTPDVSDLQTYSLFRCISFQGGNHIHYMLIFYLFYDSMIPFLNCISWYMVFWIYYDFGFNKLYPALINWDKFCTNALSSFIYTCAYIYMLYK